MSGRIENRGFAGKFFIYAGNEYRMDTNDRIMINGNMLQIVRDGDPERSTYGHIQGPSNPIGYVSIVPTHVPGLNPYAQPPRARSYNGNSIPAGATPIVTHSNGGMIPTPSPYTGTGLTRLPDGRIVAFTTSYGW